MAYFRVGIRRPGVITKLQQLRQATNLRRFYGIRTHIKRLKIHLAEGEITRMKLIVVS